MKPTIVMLVCAAAFLSNVGARPVFLSPDRRLELYCQERNADGTGARLFLRPLGSREPGVFMIENDRWIDVRWAPDSRLMAIINHPDGHVSDVYVYRITRRGKNTDADVRVHHQKICQLTGDVADFVVLSNSTVELIWHTPDPWCYDVMWDVLRWDSKRKQLLLSKWRKDTDKGNVVVTRVRVDLPSDKKPVDANNTPGRTARRVGALIAKWTRSKQPGNLRRSPKPARTLQTTSLTGSDTSGWGR